VKTCSSCPIITLAASSLASVRPSVCLSRWYRHRNQDRIKASAGPGAVPNAGPFETYNQLTTPTNCGLPKPWARVLQPPSHPLNVALTVTLNGKRETWLSYSDKDD